MKKNFTRIFALVLIMTLCASFNTMAFAADATSKEAIVATAAANYVLIDSFNLSAAPNGGNRTYDYKASGYSSYQFKFTFAGANGSVINFTQTAPNGTQWAIVRGGTIGSLGTVPPTVSSASGIHKFYVETYANCIYGASITVSVYAK